MTPAVAALGLMLAASASAELRRVPGAYEAELPRRWSGRGEWAGPVRVFAYRRPGGPEPFPQIIVESYLPGNPLFKESAAYLARVRRSARPPVPSQELEGPGGRLASWDLEYEEDEPVLAPQRRGPRRMRERFVLIDRPAGFYVVKLKARAESFPRLLPEFARFLKSLRFLD